MSETAPRLPCRLSDEVRGARAILPQAEVSPARPSSLSPPKHDGEHSISLDSPRVLSAAPPTKSRSHARVSASPYIRCKNSRFDGATQNGDRLRDELNCNLQKPRTELRTAVWLRAQAKRRLATIMLKAVEAARTAQSKSAASRPTSGKRRR